MWDAVGMPHVAGMTVRRRADSPGSFDVRIGGEPLQLDETYVVVGTDAEFSPIANYLVIPEDLIEFEVPTIVPKVLEGYIARRSPLSAPDMDRIVL
jgi:hypothetical protein